MKKKNGKASLLLRQVATLLLLLVSVFSLQIHQFTEHNISGDTTEGHVHSCSHIHGHSHPHQQNEEDDSEGSCPLCQLLSLQNSDMQSPLSLITRIQLRKFCNGEIHLNEFCQQSAIKKSCRGPPHFS